MIRKKALHKLHVFGTFLFLYLPILVLVAFSFNTKTFPAPWHGFTLNWYRELFRSYDLWESFFNSLKIASITTLLSLFLSTLLIYFLDSGSKKGRRLLPLFFGSLIVPETVLAVSLLSYFSLLDIPFGMPTLIVSHTILGLGFAIPILYTRYSDLDPKLKEASLDLGATPWTTFFKITLPLLRPSLIATGLLVFVISFDDFILSYFCAGNSIQTLSLYLLSMIRQGISPVVNALSTLLLLLSSLLVLLFFSPKIRTRIY
ncbi:MAG: ABC transporter permease [Candidatus Algichlamydia australiensis]|nr:ABC transporter permease [Chlamydiales bacterium]